MEGLRKRVDVYDSDDRQSEGESYFLSAPLNLEISRSF